MNRDFRLEQTFAGFWYTQHANLLVCF